MYQANLVLLIILISISTGMGSNSTTTISTTTTTTAPLSPCTYCRTKACRCSTNNEILNCSSYLLNLTYASDCTDIQIWPTIDFSFRNLEYFDGIHLLSLRTQHLFLQSNSISRIYANAFDSIADILLELDLQMNLLSSLSSQWLNSNFLQLKILNFAYNQLETLHDLQYVDLPNLQQLNLSRNQIEIFPYEINQWTSLTKLDLSFNKLSTVPRFALINLQKLTWLSLAYNRHLHCKNSIE